MKTPHLVSLATATPSRVVEQAETAAIAPQLFGGDSALLEAMRPVFENAGIDRRHLAQPLDWYSKSSGWKETQALFVQHALDLLERAARDAVAEAGLAMTDIDTVMTVCTTGISTPSLESHLKNRLSLRDDVMRLPIFGWGCAGGVLGLMRAADVAKAHPGSNVLLLVVELCTLTFRPGELTKSNVVASALFGDGAAAAVISTTGSGPKIAAGCEHTWPDSLGVMGWRVEDDGLGVVFSRDIPNLVRNDMKGVLDGFLQSQGLILDDINAFAPHPGGAKVLDALESVFGLTEGGLGDARDVLRNYGNMSSATVMFVLQRVLRRGLTGRCLLSALGPGFTAALGLLEAET